MLVWLFGRLIRTNFSHQAADTWEIISSSHRRGIACAAIFQHTQTTCHIFHNSQGSAMPAHHQHRPRLCGPPYNQRAQSHNSVFPFRPTPRINLCPVSFTTPPPLSHLHPTKKLPHHIARHTPPCHSTLPRDLT
jgi:hypothetical protein